MYGRLENNEIKRYNHLPKALWNGVGYITVTEDNAEQLGFKPLTIPEFDSRTHKRSGAIIETESGFEYEVVSLNKTVDDFKDEFTLRLKGYWKEAFAEGKPYMDFMAATGQEVPQEVSSKVSALYGLLTTIKGQIAALETVQDALDYELPMEQINEGLAYLRQLI